MLKKMLFCFSLIMIVNNCFCSEPLKNKILRATVHGATNGTLSGLLFTIPAVIASKDTPKERFLLLTLSSLASATGGAIFGGISALFPNRDPRDTNNYWRAGIAGAISGTAIGLTAATLYYFKDFTVFNP